MKILLLEDDRDTAQALEKGLASEGHQVATAGTAQEAFALLDSEIYDAAILDIVVPGGSGYDVLERLRTGAAPTRVLMLTARGAVEERVEGLDRGADDYLVKPFSFAELEARLRVMERGRRERGPKERRWELRVGELRLDLRNRLATAGDRRLDLTSREFALLTCLLAAEGQPVSRRELLSEVWGYDFQPGTNVVDVHVHRLRRKLESAGVPNLIRTLRGRGYVVA